MKTLATRGGHAVPALGLGTWQLTDDQAAALVPAAIAQGFRHIDAASIYANEVGVGRGLATALGSGVVRDELWVTSKLWNDGHLPQDVRPALEKTLADLQLRQLDLYLMHWPIAHRRGVVRPAGPEDFLTLGQAPLADTWRAMDACRQAGLCREIGVSNFSVKKLRELIAATSLVPAFNQVEAHPYLPQRELLAFCREHGIVLTAYSPLGSGGRPEGMRQSQEPTLLLDPTLQAIARRHRATPAQVALAWAIARGTAAIPKSSRADRLAENLAATRLTLAADDVQAIDQIDQRHRYVDGTFWEVPGGPYTVANLWDEPAATAAAR